MTAHLADIWAQCSPEVQNRLRAIAYAARQQRPIAEYEAWCRHILASQDLAPAKHHLKIIETVESVINGTGPRRLLIHAPPGSAKSTYTSELLPVHLLNRFPRFNLIGASNTAQLAEDFSNRSLSIIARFPELMRFSLRQKSAPLWITDRGGRYRAVGVGGAIAGNRADGAIIDDPVRTREEANSEVLREKIWNWFISDLRTRLKPDAWIIVIMTRWHPDDLGGRLLERQPGFWHVLNLPAEAYGDVPDPLGRAPGELLWADDAYGFGNALKLIKQEFEAAGAMRDWASLYQGRPTNAEGSLFKVYQLETIDAPPAFTGYVARGWDLAATRKTGTNNPDWTVGCKIQRNSNNTYTILDVVRLRGGPEEVEAAILNTAKADGTGVRISIPQDVGQAGKAQGQALTRLLSGYRVEVTPESGDKATRASTVAAQVNVGNVSMLRGSWNAAFREELAAFPSTLHDDQVDALSRAFTMVSLRRAVVASDAALRDMKHGLRKTY